MTARAWFAPEVLQTFAMDCGPAALSSLLGGHRIAVSFERLRAACQTTVDGTSIDDLEAVARDLGLQAEQILVPTDYVLDRATGCLPCIAVTQDPGGALHFLVLWARVGNRVQVMDPRLGRRWVSVHDIAQDLYVHEHDITPEAWAAFATTPAFRHFVARRAQAQRLLSWREHTAADLDGALRWTQALEEAGAVSTAECAPLVQSLLASPQAIPAAGRFATPEGDHVHLRGAVVLRAGGRRPDVRSATEVEARGWTETRPPTALALWRLIDDRRMLLLIAGGVVAAGVATVVEAVLLRGWLDMLYLLGTPSHRLGAAVALAVFLSAALALHVPMVALTLRTGRQLELRLRAAFLHKLPRLPEAYLSGRPTSDWAERSHALHVVRQLPGVVRRIAGHTVRIAMLVLGIGWISLYLLPIALGVAALSVALPIAVHRTHQQRDLRARTQAGALARFSLDAMLGLVAIRTHGAEATVRSEHEALLAEWARSSLAVHRWIAGSSGVQILIALVLAAALLVVHVDPSGELASGAGSTLLLVYWALLLPTYGELLAGALRELPHATSVAVRLLEPLAAPERAEASTTDQAGQPVEVPEGAAAIALQGVTVALGGRDVLRDVSASLQPGEHVAVVGASGAGKSTVVATLLGLAEPTAGMLQIDGSPATPSTLQALRRRCAWVDPAVQLWNRSMLYNLRYGIAAGAGAPVGDCVQQAELMGVVEQLPDGMSSRLGEGGSRLSGGEGNRVRYGRALGRPDVRLVLLDEAFRGLDRWARTTLLARARGQFTDTTLVCVTHDVADTAQFPRVWVLDGGRLVQDGPPAELAAADGVYRTLLAKEKDVQRDWWSFTGWRRWWVDGGTITEEST